MDKDKDPWTALKFNTIVWCSMDVTMQLKRELDDDDDDDDDELMCILQFCFRLRCCNCAVMVYFGRVPASLCKRVLWT